MDKETKQYRASQIGKCKNDNDYVPSIKLFGSVEGKTNCLSISLDEFIAIRKILLDEKEFDVKTLVKELEERGKGWDEGYNTCRLRFKCLPWWKRLFNIF